MTKKTPSFLSGSHMQNHALLRSVCSDRHDNWWELTGYGNCSDLGWVQVEQPQAGNYLWGCVFSPRDPRAKRLETPLRIALQTPTVSQLAWFWVAMGNTQGSRGFIFGRLIGKQAHNLAINKGNNYVKMAPIDPIRAV